LQRTIGPCPKSFACFPSLFSSPDFLPFYLSLFSLPIFFPLHANQWEATPRCAALNNDHELAVSRTGGFSMSKLRNILAAAVAFSVSIVLPAFPQGIAGCRTGLFIGTYTHLVTYSDIWMDGSDVLNQTISQITLHLDGTANEFDTAWPDLMLSLGTSSPLIGSWTCRSDGKLVVTMIAASYAPTTDAKLHPKTVPNPPPVDLLLYEHYRLTYLFSVTDVNTLTMTEYRVRQYAATADPTNPAGGVLQPLNTVDLVYQRLVASDADLLAP
jgi:hypothetical protein